MADLRTAMKEFRFLEDKRQAAGLTPAEEARYQELQDVLARGGAEPAAGSGFDVNAASASIYSAPYVGDNPPLESMPVDAASEEAPSPFGLDAPPSEASPADVTEVPAEAVLAADVPASAPADAPMA